MSHSDTNSDQNPTGNNPLLIDNFHKTMRILSHQGFRYNNDLPEPERNFFFFNLTFDIKWKLKFHTRNCFHLMISQSDSASRKRNGEQCKSDVIAFEIELK
jgi:hypothetical protein